MNVNVKKVKTVIVSRDGGGVVNITVDGQKAEQVRQFKYLVPYLLFENCSNLSLLDIKAELPWQKMHSTREKRC